MGPLSKTLSSAGTNTGLRRGLGRFSTTRHETRPRGINVSSGCLNIRQNKLAGLLCFMFLLPVVLYTSNRKLREFWMKKYEVFNILDKVPELQDRLFFEPLRGFNAHWRRRYLYDPTWSRFDVQWFKREVVRRPNLEESLYRVLYSPVRSALSDGIGHGVSIWNIEVITAIRLGLTYSHRVSSYSTLTRNDSLAVENFFGWGQGELSRDDVRINECKGNDIAEVSRCQICRGIDKSNTESTPLGMQRVVEIPRNVAVGCRIPRPGSDCEQWIRDFLAENNKSHTIFQMPVGLCDSPPTSSYFLLTRSILAEKYWKQHSREYNHDSQYAPRSPTRKLRFDDRELTIAIHVRRGDFLNIKHRLTIDDRVYARLVGRVLTLVSSQNNTFAEVPVAVSIYSEGRILKELPNSVHNIDEMDSVYVDSNGTARDVDWWKDLIDATMTSFVKSAESSREYHGKSLRVSLRIAEPVLANLHEMISADIFIGSASGLSTNIVWSLARGIAFVPKERELDKGGCCAVIFDPFTGDFDKSLFERFWDIYVEANFPSLEYAVHRRILSEQKDLAKDFRALKRLELPVY